MPNNSLIVECGEKSRYISYNNIYLTDVDYTTYSYVYSFDGEGTITSAIDYVISDELPKVYKLEGHGEAELPAEFQTQIEKENMEMESFSLLNMDEIPEDADALLTTSDEAFSKAAGFELSTYEKEDGDTDGPFAVAVSVDTGNDGQLIWFASSDFLDEMYNAYSSGANLDLAMNALQPDWRARSGADSQQVSELQLSDDLRVGGVDAQDVDDRRDPRRIRGLRCVYGH